ncbi:unnamed protein product, partial [Onchocerca ochengi]
GEHICGAVVNVRQKGDKVSLWTRDSLKDDVNLRIGQILKAKLEIPDSEPIRYEVHKVILRSLLNLVKVGEFRFAQLIFLIASDFLRIAFFSSIIKNAIALSCNIVTGIEVARHLLFK